MDDNTFECPNCSARIYPEMTRCPQCGQNMYPEDEELTTPEVQADSSSWMNFTGAVMIGWIISAGLALIVHFVIARFFTPTTLGTTGRFVLFMAGPAGAFTGAYVAGGIARRHGLALGAIVGILALPVSILLTTYWVEVTLGLLLSASVLGAGSLIILGGVIGGWLSQRLSLDTGLQEKWKVRGWEDLLYQELLRKVRFSGPAADRLIEYERNQDPQASRLKLIQNAIERWERDNR